MKTKIVQFLKKQRYDNIDRPYRKQHSTKCKALLFMNFITFIIWLSSLSHQTQQQNIPDFDGYNQFCEIWK